MSKLSKVSEFMNDSMDDQICVCVCMGQTHTFAKSYFDTKLSKIDVTGLMGYWYHSQVIHWVMSWIEVYVCKIKFIQYFITDKNIKQNLNMFFL